jgi:hypothetical protein
MKSRTIIASIADLIRKGYVLNVRKTVNVEHRDVEYSVQFSRAFFCLFSECRRILLSALKCN